MNELHSSCESVVCNNCHDNLVALSLGNFQIANLITSFSFDHNFYFTISNEKCNSFLISTYWIFFNNIIFIFLFEQNLPLTYLSNKFNTFKFSFSLIQFCSFLCKENGPIEFGWGYHLIFFPLVKTFFLRKNCSNKSSTKQLRFGHHLIPSSPKKLFLKELD